jgi:acetylornithine aminotransferase
MGAVTLTGQAHYHEGFQPLLPQVAYCAFNDPAALEEAFATQRVAGVFFESVQGEGGITPMDKDTARTLAKLASQHNALLVADEVQTGVGRTGRFFGFEHDGLRPEVITLAKGLGAGLPIGAVLVHPKTADLLKPGAHGTTFGGNPVACAAGNAVLDVLERDALVPRAGKLGERFKQELEAEGVAARGRGLLVGLPFFGPMAPKVVADLRGKGILVGQAGKNVLRVAPPLVIPEGELLGAVPTIAQSIREVQGKPASPATNP